MDEYGRHFGERSFWDKVKRFGRQAGRKVLQPALTLYFCLRDDDTPAWAKTVIVGSLGYFILPLDAIPDATPLAGFTDDLGALTAALGIVAAHTKPEHRERARTKVRGWLGDDEEERARPSTGKVSARKRARPGATRG